MVNFFYLVNIESYKMLTFHDFLGKNYYDAMIILKEYNHLNNENIQFVIVKINNNVKFIKHVHIKSIFYINLECDDMDISNTLNEILNKPYESDRRHETRKYIQNLLQDPENCKKFMISHIYQK